MQLVGEFKLTIGGVERNFKLGTLSDNLFCEYENIKLKDYVERVKNPKAFTQLNLVYSQAVAYARINKQPIDFTIDDVSVWIDEVGEEAFAKEYVKIHEAQGIKNQTAPLTTGL